jgi:hypothetical protein
MDRRDFLLRSTLGGIGAAFTAGLAAQDNENLNSLITAETQEAIDKGLEYLASHQAADGSMGSRQLQSNVAVTSLGGLAFMASGSQPGRGKYGSNVRKALEAVLASEERGTPGFLNTRGHGGFHGPMYGHGFATLFLAEVHGMVNQPALRNQLRATLGRAVNLIINGQNHRGGWRYRPRDGDDDISATICQIMALRAARNAGITVPKTTADRCIQYVKNCQDPNSGGFRYQPGLGPAGFARTAAGIVALYSAGLYDDDTIKKGLDYLKRFQPGGNQGFFGNAEMQMHYYYGHYYAAQAMWIAGPAHFGPWYRAIRDELLRRDRNRADGSWFNGQFCPEYCTAMALIVLQIPNNYLPILHR